MLPRLFGVESFGRTGSLKSLVFVCSIKILAPHVEKPASVDL